MNIKAKNSPWDWIFNPIPRGYVNYIIAGQCLDKFCNMKLL